jgi:glycosyltransferase involved in cell wall biosynthesis
MRHVVVMIATSYPRFPGDGVGSFMEPIAKGIAARGHEVHLVAPWHPAITRGREEDGVHFHFFRYAPLASLNVFGYASGLRADTHLKGAAWAVAPAAMASGWFKAMRVAHKRHATLVHAHWVIPGGVIGALAAQRRPLVVSLHGSDVFVAERHPAMGHAARSVFGRAAWVTACSDDLHQRALRLGARPTSTETIPYGVDIQRFAPDAAARAEIRSAYGVGEAPLVFSAGRLVSKKGFEVLIDAIGRVRDVVPGTRLIIAGDGDLRAALHARAAHLEQPVLVGAQPQDVIARFTAAADVVAVPSVHDDAGNVDGLPNVALEALASGTPVIASRVGGLPQAIEDGVTGVLVAERDVIALADALTGLLTDPSARRAIGESGRRSVARNFSWGRVAERFDEIYARVGR